MNSQLKRFFIVLLILLLVLPLSLSAKGNQASENSNKPHLDHQLETPEFNNVSVHDPSIIKEDDMYYVFGTHIEAAKSKDLMDWESFANGYTTPNNVLYGDLSENLAESFEWAGEDDADSAGGFAVWAPDIFWNDEYVNEDGTKGAYMMYYSASSTYIRSAIGYAVSKDIEGPYQYVDTIVYSGFTEGEDYDDNSDVNKQWENTAIDELIDKGEISEANADWFNEDGSYNNTMYPNAIDANLFYDEDDKLWMTYGSWSGGLFMYELDEATGLPIYPGEDRETEDGRMIDRYFGTKISGGYGKSGEGPYIVYNEDNGYYYLYITNGWLGADGEYNMRVFRSENPDGPYLDADGQDAVLPGNVDHAPYGNKLMGHFMFERKIGDPGTGIGYGYISPGHNSVYYDEDTGEQFLVFHSRFPERGETHEVRIHQLFINEDGWPVAAPYRYGGETLEKVNRQDVVGDYRFINHGQDISSTVHKDVNITLEKNNKITGAVSGKWKKTGHNQVELEIDGETYKGVFVRQFDPVTQSTVMTFTASSGHGVSVWGSMRDMGKTDEEIVADVKEDLNLGETDRVVTDLTLPTEGTRDTEISWTSSDVEVVSEQGVLNRPESDEESKTVTLTATITKGEVTDTKSFSVTVLPKGAKQVMAHYSFENDLSDSTGNFGEGTLTGNRIDNTGGTISFDKGVVGQASVFDGNSGVKLPDNLITGTSYSVSLWLNPKTLTGYTTSFFGARDSSNWVSLLPGGWPGDNQVAVWSGGSSFTDATTGTELQTDEWTHLAMTVDDGEVIVYLNGEEKSKTTAFNNVFTTSNSQFSLGVNWWDTPYQGMMDELSIYQGKLTAEEVAQLAAE
ncbi:LamG-like jellyroll fold domain-containing protein [Aquibacillus saliphilus]|uniref:LamG-like jellyroll fold domain-containing protein n=1 Tax=Aquibacillus saliphilus TaxID=1909422 RepID=UPI001CF032DA|nr:LamG-like jellyroll fold domain-containing protein [Aquibacillus saliphilus]